jgi:D-alanine-D-alanine ligase
MAKYAGLSYSRMLGRILKSAEERFGMEPENGAREEKRAEQVSLDAGEAA